MATIHSRGDPRQEALAHGFDAVGFAEAHLADSARADLAEFLARAAITARWTGSRPTRRGAAIPARALWGEARRRSSMPGDEL